MEQNTEQSINKELTPESIWREYQRGAEHQAAQGLHERVRRNENFYLGRQWEGLKAPDLEKPVLNFLKRVVGYFIAMLVSDDVGVTVNSFRRTLESDIADSALTHEVERVIERNKLKSLNRSAIRDAAVDGTACLYLRFEPKQSGAAPQDEADAQPAEMEEADIYAPQGEITAELLQAEQLIFGNPYEAEAQLQPYIIVAQRLFTESVREEARRRGLRDWQLLRPDRPDYAQEEGEERLTTVLTRFWRGGDGRLRFCRSTRELMLQEETPTSYRLYPICTFSWEKVRNSYLGQAALTDGVVQNQIFVNTMWALFMIQAKKATFPTVFYDATKIDSWRNKPGGAVAVQGSPDSNVVMDYRPADFSPQALEIVRQTIEYTKEFMGVSDAALGNIVHPDNASAIIAVQQAAAAPLDVQRLAFYQFVEDYVRVIVDIIGADYGLRRTVYQGGGGSVETVLDFSTVDCDACSVNVEVGAGSYWSETMQIQTLDNLFAKGIIRDAATYLAGVPDKYVRNKRKILEALEQSESAYSLTEEGAAV